MRSAVSDMKAMGPPGDVRGLQFDIACVGSETANIEGLPADVRLADYPASANQILCLKRAAPKLDRQVVVAQASNDAELSAALL